MVPEGKNVVSIAIHAWDTRQNFFFDLIERLLVLVTDMTSKMIS